MRIAFRNRREKKKKIKKKIKTTMRHIKKKEFRKTVSLEELNTTLALGKIVDGSSLLRFFIIALLFGAVFAAQTRHNIMKRNYSDQSVRGYLAERTCWWNEVCKEEFHSKFRCRCPRWSYCRAPGRYYDAHCSMTRTGYIWTQPETNLGLEIDK